MRRRRGRCAVCCSARRRGCRPWSRRHKHTHEQPQHHRCAHAGTHPVQPLRLCRAHSGMRHCGLLSVIKHESIYSSSNFSPPWPHAQENGVCPGSPRTQRAICVVVNKATCPRARLGTENGTGTPNGLHTTHPTNTHHAPPRATRCLRRYGGDTIMSTYGRHES